MTRSTPGRHRCNRLRLGTGVLVCSLVGASAGAQQLPPAPTTTRPMHALFGGFEGNEASKQSLDLSVSVSGQGIDNLIPPGFTPAPADRQANPWFSQSLIYTGANVQASYVRHWSRGSFDASTGHGGYYSLQSGQFSGAIHTGVVGVTTELSQRISLQASQSVAYSPFYGLNMFPGGDPSGVVIWTPLYGISLQHNLRTTTFATLSGQLTRRLTLDTDYSLQQMRFTTQDRAFTSTSIGGRLAMQATRDLTVHAGYRQHQGDYGALYSGGTIVVQRDIDAGFDYARTLPLGRHSSIRAGTGSTIFSNQIRTYYRFMANATLDTAIGRDWTSHVRFLHGLQWIEGLPQPLYSEFVQGGTSGFVGRRVEMTLDAGYSWGRPGFAPGATTNLETYTARAQLRTALTRFAAVRANYFYYHYEFGAGFPLPPGTAPTLNRQSVSVGVDLWLPLLR